MFVQCRRECFPNQCKEYFDIQTFIIQRPAVHRIALLIESIERIEIITMGINPMVIISCLVENVNSSYLYLFIYNLTRASIKMIRYK